MKLQKMLFLSLILTQAFASSKGGGGGAFSEVDFVNIGRNTSKLLRPYETKVSFSLDKLDSTISKAKVEALQKKPQWNGVEKDAVADVEKQYIGFYYPSFTYKMDYLRRVIVLHEYLRLMEVDDENYQVSLSTLNILFDPPVAQLQILLTEIANTSKVLIRVSKEKAVKKTSECYSLRGLEDNIKKIKEFDEIIKPLRTSWARARLPHHTVPIYNYCNGHKYLDMYGFRYKNTKARYQLFLNNIHKDAKETLIDISK